MSIRHSLSGIPVPQHSFPQICGKDFSYKQKAPQIPSRKIAGRISLAKNLSLKLPSRNFAGSISLTQKICHPKFLPAILREAFLLRPEECPLR
jgi:hypothetical protein